VNLEHELKKALGRENPGEEFTRALLSRIAAMRSRRKRRRMLLAIAASLALVAGGSFRLAQYHRERAEAQWANAQLRLALRITGEKLQLARQKVVIKLNRREEN
jgi:hypothetical protein